MTHSTARLISPKQTKTSSTFDRSVKRYDAWYDKYESAYLSELMALKKVMPRKGKGLEIGVGTARFAAPLGIEFGIDPSIKMLEVARRRGVKVELGVGENLPFDDATFDYVAIITTLCFVKDPLQVLKEAQRVLRKDGKLVLCIVDRDSFLGRFYQKSKSVFYKQIKFFGVEELANLLKATGFGRFSIYQTIYEFPEKINAIQKPKKGFGEGGFVIISAYKSRLPIKTEQRSLRHD
jgi:ubiquinone/menaquinone biosynthesis C-methylase UbiE